MCDEVAARGSGHEESMASMVLLVYDTSNRHLSLSTWICMGCGTDQYDTDGPTERERKTEGKMSFVM